MSVPTKVIDGTEYVRFADHIDELERVKKTASAKALPAPIDYAATVLLERHGDPELQRILRTWALFDAEISHRRFTSATPVAEWPVSSQVEVTINLRLIRPSGETEGM